MQKPARLDRVGWLGETSGPESKALVARAEALLMPLAWDEPFGLVVIEAMLAGTPVIACRRASMPEIVEDGVTGYLVDDERAMAATIPKARSLDRRRVRARARMRFAATRMAADYEKVHRMAIEGSARTAAFTAGA